VCAGQSGRKRVQTETRVAQPNEQGASDQRTDDRQSNDDSPVAQLRFPLNLFYDMAYNEIVNFPW
jgi:hypothetical protein